MSAPETPEEEKHEAPRRGEKRVSTVVAPPQEISFANQDLIEGRRPGEEDEITPEKLEQVHERSASFGVKGGLLKGLQTEKQGLDKLRELDERAEAGPKE